MDIANTHEGDWEMYQIILGSDNQPLLITYSFHLGGQTFQWSDEEVGKSEDGNHPLVYVALGGHGSWNKGGNHTWYQKLGKCLKCKDETKKGDVLYPPNFPEDEIQTTYSKYSYTLVKMSDWKENDWIYWNGYWGNQIVKGFSGPSSPPYIDYIDDGIDSRWKKPILWATSPNPSDYEICTSSNINVIARDEKRNIVRIIKKCSPFTKIIYSEKDLIFDVYSLDGEDVNLKISRYDRVTRSTHEVEFDWLAIPKNGKATLRFSSEQNPNLEMEIDHDQDGIFDYRVSPDYATQNP